MAKASEASMGAWLIGYHDISESIRDNKALPSRIQHTSEALVYAPQDFAQIVTPMLSNHAFDPSPSSR